MTISNRGNDLTFDKVWFDTGKWMKTCPIIEKGKVKCLAFADTDFSVMSGVSGFVTFNCGDGCLVVAFSNPYVGGVKGYVQWYKNKQSFETYKQCWEKMDNMDP